MSSLNNSASILIVDDNPVNRRVLTFILQEHYPQLQIAKDGAKCLQILAKQTPDLVLLDLNMPLKSGFEVLAEVAESTLATKPTFIVVSADNNPVTISRALKLGASDYVTTPFNRAELMARVKTHLALRSREQDLEERVATRTVELEAANDALKKTQHQLILAEKMASLGQLSAGIAHEINNPIGYIQSNLDSLQHYVQDLVELIGHYQQAEVFIDNTAARNKLTQQQAKINLPFLKKDIQELMNDSLHGALRVKQIVNDLKVFSHPKQSAWERLNIKECLQAVLNIVHSEIKYKADVRLHLDEPLPDIQCMTTQIYQVLTNLIVNAAQAIESHGDIHIHIRSLQPAQQQIEIRVRDNGCGMSDETKTKIFDPFFTTKPVGEGTGLGLSVSYGIIESHHGSINVESQPGQGSCFIVCLPIEQQ